MSYIQQVPHVMGNQFFNGNNNQSSSINGSANLWSRNNNGFRHHSGNSPRFFGAGNVNHFGGGLQNFGISIFGPQQQFQQPPPYHPQQSHMNLAANFLGVGQKHSPPIDNWPNFKLQGQQHPPAPVMMSRKEVRNGEYFNNLHFQSPPGFNGWGNGGSRVYGPHHQLPTPGWNAGYEMFDLNPMQTQHQQHPIALNFPPGFGPYKFGAQQQFQPPPPPYVDHIRHQSHQHQVNLWRNEVNQFHQQPQPQSSNGAFNHGFNHNHPIYQPVAALAPLPSPTPVYQQHQHQKSGGDFGVVGDKRASKGSVDIEMTSWENLTNKVREDDQKISIDQTEATVVDDSKAGIEEGPNFDPNIDYQLCPTSNPVLPPPPIELSAVPIGSLGYEVVWQCCRLSFEKNEGNHQSVSIGFGAIGSEMQMARNLKRRNDGDFFDDSNSEASSPSSSCPGTPGEEAIRPRNFGTFTSKGKGNEWSGFDFPQILQTKLQPKKQETLKSGGAENKLDLEPSQNFKNFTKEILEKTLLTPQVLILGIYFVSKVTEILNLSNLPAESPFANASSAPYRMLVVSLMIANKILDDNSYRSETFASVSGIPLNELNLMEMNFLGALNFETNLDRPGWTRWLSQLLDREYMKESGDVNLKVQEVLGDILQKTCEEACLNSPSSRSTCDSLISENSEESLVITLTGSEVNKRNFDASSPKSYYEMDFDEEYEENPIPGEYNSRSMMQSSFYQK